MSKLLSNNLNNTNIYTYLEYVQDGNSQTIEFNNSESSKILQEFLSYNGPCVCEVFTDPNEAHEPKVVASLDKNGNFIPGELHNIKWKS